MPRPSRRVQTTTPSGYPLVSARKVGELRLTADFGENHRQVLLPEVGSIVSTTSSPFRQAVAVIQFEVVFLSPPI